MLILPPTCKSLANASADRFQWTWRSAENRCAGFQRLSKLPHLMVKVPKAIGLNAIGDNRKQQMTRQMIGRWSLQHALPPRAQTFEIETAQMRDLILNRYLGRETTLATLLPHRIRPPASRDRQPLTKPCYP